jgi:transposase
MKARKQMVYTAEFRAEAVKLVLEKKQRVGESAERLGIPKQTLNGWVNVAKNGKLALVNSQRLQAVQPIEAEVARLKKALALAEMERDILKKAAAYFAKESQQGTRS